MSTFVTYRGRWLIGLAALSVLVAFAAAGIASADGSGWRHKVDASVLSDAEVASTEFIVHLKEQADLSAAGALDTKQAKGRFVYERLTSVARSSQAPLLAELQQRGVDHRSFWVTNSIWAVGNLSDVEAIAERPEVDHVYAIGTGRLDPPIPVDVPGGTESASFTTAVFDSIAKVNADDAWALGYRGQGAVVAGADTGVRWTHEALKSRYRGWDGTTANHDYNWHDAIHNPNAFCPANSPQPCDDDALIGGGHGTHTVGTMVGSGVERTGQKNEIGMAPDAKWIACRNMNNGLGVVPTYMECMQWFIAPTKVDGTGADPSKAPDVVNNSWGCVEVCPPPLLQDMLQASRAAGIFYAVSAGNDGVGAPPPAAGCNTIHHPLARYPEAFTVGSTTWTTDTISSFSSRGPVLGDPTAPLGLMKPNITAPGSSVRSAQRANDSAYGSLSGTSMAGPHVAGLVALIISANPSLRGDVDAIEDIIEQTAVPKATNEGCGGDSSTQVPNNTYGWGRIDALAAVDLAANEPPDAVDDSATVAREGSVTIPVLANDSDPDGDTLTIASFTQGSYGTVSDNGDGTLTYTQDGGPTASDSFSYTISDGNGGSDSANVSITVTGPDLVVSNMTATSNTGSGGKSNQPREGDKVTVSATIANDGTGAAPATKTEFVLDGSTVLGMVDTPPLAPGERATVSVLLDTRGMKGEHSVRATADEAGDAAETNETNNLGVLTFSVKGNKVSNPSFEQPSSGGSEPANWSGSSTEAGTTSWSDGEKSASMSGTGGNALAAGPPTWTSAPIAVTPGEALDLVVSIRTSGVSSAPSAGLVYLGALGQVLDTVKVITAPLTTAGFQTLEQSVTVPAGVTSARLVLTGFAPTDLATAGTVTFDDVGLFAR